MKRWLWFVGAMMVLTCFAGCKKQSDADAPAAPPDNRPADVKASSQEGGQAGPPDNRPAEVKGE